MPELENMKAMNLVEWKSLTELRVIYTIAA